MIEAEHAEAFQLQGKTQRLEEIWLVVDDHDWVRHHPVRSLPLSPVNRTAQVLSTLLTVSADLLE
jgi:hypothetical protein